MGSQNSYVLQAGATREGRGKYRTGIGSACLRSSVRRSRPQSCASPSTAPALGFSSTAELEPITGLIGQERALRAIQFAANMRSHDFNLFVAGAASLGQEHGSQSLPRQEAAGAPAPPDGSMSTI